MQSKEPLYLDYAATTPVDPRVLEEMLPYFTEYFGNPSSHHAHGEYAKQAVDKAKAQTANLINSEPEEVIFTSGATEGQIPRNLLSLNKKLVELGMSHYL